MIHIARGFGIAVLAYLVLLVAHFLWEAWIIATYGFDSLEECRRWWCPHGMLNRRRAARDKSVTRDL